MSVRYATNAKTDPNRLRYASEQHLSSGLVAVVFALQIVWNLAGSKLFFGSSMPGPVLFGAALAKALTAPVVTEIMFWYPPTLMVMACWAYALAAALTLAALPGLAALARPNGWSVARKAGHGIALASFAACAATAWGLGFLGFSGW